MARRSEPQTESEWCPEHGQLGHFLGTLFDRDGHIAGEALHCPECHPDHPENPWPSMPRADVRSLRVLQGTLLGGKVHPARNTLFVPLPRELWRPIEPGCVCDFCKAHPSIRPYWDTLAISTKASSQGGSDTTWLIHMPEAHHHD